MTTTTAHTGKAALVDTHLGKFTQGGVVLLTGLAFVLNQPLIVLITAFCMVIAVLVPAASPFRLIYRGVVLSLHLWKPRIAEDDPAPHRFAQAVGATFLLVATLLFYLFKVPVAGWVLDVIVFALAGINLTVGFCAGCFVYYHLGRIGWLPKTRYGGNFHWRGV